MKVILIGVLLFLLSVELHSDSLDIQQTELKPATPVVKIELPSTPFYEQSWFNTLIGAIIGAGLTFLITW